MTAKTAIERAFEIARSGRFTRLDYLQKQLAQEGYDPSSIFGRQISKQLHALAREAKAKQADPSPMSAEP